MAVKKSAELKRIEKKLKKAADQGKKIDMRDYIQYHLDLYGMGKLVAVKGPERGGKQNDQSWWQLRLVYRTDPNAHHFEDGYIEVYLGYKNKGGYWNRRQIRVAIEKRAKKLRDEQVVELVWSRAQLSIESGTPKDENGAFAL